jgi:hypothetical protein
MRRSTGRAGTGFWIFTRISGDVSGGRGILRESWSWNSRQDGARLNAMRQALRKKLWNKKGAARKINRSEQTKEIIGENYYEEQIDRS